MASGTIYAIGIEGTTLVKIGCTTLPIAKRLGQLQTGQPHKLLPLATIAVDADMTQIERQIHVFLATERTRGEWFDVAIDTPMFVELIARAVAYLADQQAPSAWTPQEVAHRDRLKLTATRVYMQRRALDLTQQELAERCGFPYQIISRVEQAHQDLYAERVIALANALGVSTDYLLGRVLGKKELL